MSWNNLAPPQHCTILTKNHGEKYNKLISSTNYRIGKLLVKTMSGKVYPVSEQWEKGIHDMILTVNQQIFLETPCERNVPIHLYKFAIVQIAKREKVTDRKYLRKGLQHI